MRKKHLVFLFALFLAFVLGACGSSAGGSYKMAEEAPAAMENSSYITEGFAADMAMQEAPAEEAVEEEGIVDSSAPDMEDQASVNRKLIKTVHMDVETEDYPAMIVAVGEKVDSIGGYIEFYESYNENNIGHRGCNYKLRIPAQKLDSFIDEVDEISNITYRQESVEDVTLQYVDLESHKKMLLEEQERLLELLTEAETIEDIISIESRLTEVRYQLESMESQLRAIDNKVTYSTIYLNINEVTRYTPPVEKGAWERMTTGFVENIYNVIDGIKEFGIRFVIAIPLILVYAVILVAAVVVIKIIKRSIVNRKRKKTEMKTEKPAESKDTVAENTEK